MKLTRAASAIAITATCLIFACATGSLHTSDDDDDASTSTDGTVSGDSSACPDADLQTDPNHCGTCTNTCTNGQVCSSGACKSQCAAPTTKCTVGDGGVVCANTSSDVLHCGSCTNACSAPDGGPNTGTNNPDAGIPIPDGGFDAGNGWSLSTATCDASACGLECASGNLCSDNLCWDPQNAHDHCGSCTTACQSTEWCTQGHCCAQGTAWCGTSCVDVLTDANNCGLCGNVCPANAPACSGGTCHAAVAVTTVCAKSNPNGIFCGGNCTNNHAQYADAYCVLAGYSHAANYTVLTSGSVTCLYYQTTLPTMCSQILGPTTYGLATSCDAIENLTCE
jgi:hypothetical protein